MENKNSYTRPKLAVDECWYQSFTEKKHTSSWMNEHTAPSFAMISEDIHKPFAMLSLYHRTSPLDVTII